MEMSLANETDTKGDIPYNLLQSLAVCDKDSFPIIHYILVIACTLPITSAKAERSFSLMRTLKTALRSTMTDVYLSDLAVIVIDYGENVTTDEICQTFVQTYPRNASLFD